MADSTQNTADITPEELLENASAAVEETAEQAVETAEAVEAEAATAADYSSELDAVAQNSVASLKTPTPGGKKKKAKNLERSNAIAGYLFLLPFIIGFCLFLLYPLGMSVRMAFSRVSATSNGLTFKWLGFFGKGTNFHTIFRVDKDYLEALGNELKRMLLFVPGILVFSFFMAMLLNQEFKGRTFVRAVYFLPVILASGVFLGMEANNALLSNVKETIKEQNAAAAITNTLEDILMQGETFNTFFQYIIDIVGQVYDIAMSSGIQIIVFLSGLQTIPPSMYEAARMEGCTAWESFWKITFPLIGSMILVNIVYTLVDFFTRSDSQLMTLINDTLLIRFEYGKVAAMSWVYFAIIAAFLGLVFLIFSRRVYYYD